MPEVGGRLVISLSHHWPLLSFKREANRKVVRMAPGPTLGSKNERAAEAALE